VFSPPLLVALVGSSPLPALLKKRTKASAAKSSVGVRRVPVLPLDKHSYIQMDIESAGVPFASQAGRRGGVLVAPSCAPKNEGSLRRSAIASGSTAVSRHKHLNIKMDIEFIGVPFASQAGRRGAPSRRANRGKMPSRHNSAEQMAPPRPPPRHSLLSGSRLLGSRHRDPRRRAPGRTGVLSQTHASGTGSLAPAVGVLPGRRTGPLRDRVNTRLADA
jgi:hypothetical protein